MLSTSGKGFMNLNSEIAIYLFDKKSYSKIFRNGKVEAVRALTLVLAFRYKKIFVPISLPPTLSV